jgi:uncharacterized caspase-like protein
VIRLALAVNFALGFLFIGGSVDAAPDRVALVIGNGKYVNANTLPNPPNDARAVGKALAAVGFDVFQGIDLNRVAMENLLRDFLTKATGAKIALLFYAGHGLQVDGRNYLIPIDAKLDSASDLNFGTVDLDKILASLDDPARANIIILDACRDNPMARSFAARSRSAAVGAGLAAYSSLGTGTLIAFSTAPGKVAGDGQGTNSPFTASLVKNLGTPGLEVRQMLTRVRAEVAATTGDKQVPWDNSSLRGDVYLAGLSPTAGPAPLQPAQSTATPVVAPTDLANRSTGTTPDAAQAWAVTKDTASPAVLQDFIRQFGKTPYGSMARARLKELRSQVAATNPGLVHAERIPLVSGQYDVNTNGYSSTFAITVIGSTFSGTSKWACCPGPRTDPIIQGRVQNGRISFVRDCTGQG